MKTAMIQRFLIIISMTLVVFGVISYIVAGKHLLTNTIEHMQQTIDTVDYMLDYSSDMDAQVQKLQEKAIGSTTRITVLKDDGSVVAETNAQTDTLDNHGDREEVRQAFLTGQGYATRYSDTLQENMLYVAKMTQNGAYMIRLAIPYNGLLDYMRLLLPSLLLGVVLLFILATVTAVRFSDAVTKPLQEIAEEMVHIRGEEPEFDFKTYQYEELNIISYTTDRLIEEIKENMDKIEFEKRIRQEFFSNASHELKTPITSVKGYAEILQNDLAKTQEAKEDCIRRIIKETDNMTNLINDILMISKLETKDLTIDISEVRMAPLLSEVAEAMEPIAAKHEVTLHLDCQPIVWRGSASQLEELLTNLMTNAIKYNHPGGDVWTTIKSNPNELMIEVKDNGIGISKEDQDRVFERFYRVDKGRSKKLGGTGLGLSIVKHIVGYYDGVIELESEMEKGSTFTIKLPMNQ